jgi:hypothetical protein
MKIKPQKQKLGRPRKKAVGFGNSSNGSKIMQQDTNSLNNSQSPNCHAQISESSNLNNPEIEDWEQEMEGTVTVDEIKQSQILETINDSSQLNLMTAQQNTAVFRDDLYSNNQIQTDDNNGNIIPLQRGQEKLKPSTKIHIIDGEKGGAGKSFVSRALIEYCRFKELDISIVDADNSNQDIAKLYDGVESAFFSDDEKQIKYADKVFYLALEKTVILNLPAQVYRNVTNWIQRNNLVELGKENSVSFIKWFVCTGSIDSVNFFLQSLNDLGNDIQHVFVRNMGLCDDWQYIEEMPEFQDAQTKYKFITIDFPKLPFWERNTIERLGTTFEQALQHPELKVVSRQRVKNFLTEAYKAFNYTGLV